MEYIVNRINNIIVIEIPEKEGGLIAPDIEGFIGHIEVLDKGVSNKIALDFIDKKYLNSSGLGELMRIKDVFVDSGADLILVNLMDRVRSLLNIVGADDFFIILDDIKDLK